MTTKTDISLSLAQRRVAFKMLSSLIDDLSQGHNGRMISVRCAVSSFSKLGLMQSFDVTKSGKPEHDEAISEIALTLYLAMLKEKLTPLYPGTIALSENIVIGFRVLERALARAYGGGKYGKR